MCEYGTKYVNVEHRGVSTGEKCVNKIKYVIMEYNDVNNRDTALLISTLTCYTGVLSSNHRAATLPDHMEWLCKPFTRQFLPSSFLF
jgi:hypothetical protein